ncbi:class I SAM-dependent methyltransferase [Sphingobium sp. SYK-6]|uniref:class I SAM-dependent methyltransferase n=1 Tax=Sphingobium sp. (strain NBRC 103272 / SYK-6) TaxID=627192 RepID=UPI0009FEA3A3|nr:class I SAM-dependent methyltransferase [Sphingobium sp. SYK-6]
MSLVMSPFGPALPEGGWVPAPRYILRRASIMEAMRDLPPGNIIEVGCGAGALLSEFAALGFDVTGLEMSVEGRALSDVFANGQARMTVRETPEDWHAHFSYLFSFEVLEHIEDDLAALREWVGWLKPGGLAVLSVPAHMKLWGNSDIFAGHFRRYSRPQFEALLQAAGLTDVRVEAYGFPVSNFIEPLRNAYHGRKLKAGASSRSMKAATENSGVDRGLETRLFPVMTAFPCRQMLQGAVRLQRLFRRSEHGTGWIGVGRKADG